MIEKIQEIKLQYSIALTDSTLNYKFPEIHQPMIVFAGRSNVGKSSVINSLVGKKIAFVSKKPGKTKQINYYLVNSKFYFVDLPGYGYAKVSKQLIAKWKYLIERFFTNHNNIKLVVLIFDIRRKWVDLDMMMFEYIKQINREFYILLNKCDTINIQEINQQIKGYIQALGIESSKILPFSAKTGVGKKDLSSFFIKLLKDTKNP